jgi:hypothetical protein
MSKLRRNLGITLATPAVLAAALASSACLFSRQPQTVFTPPPAPRVPVAEAATLPAPPRIGGDPNATIPPPTPNSVPEAPPPPVPKTPPRRPTVATAPPRTSGSAQATPAPANPATESTAPSPAPPKLGQLFTPEQLRDYNRILDESLDRVRKAMAVLAKKNLNAEQTEAANRITTFQKQAEQARDQDIVTAANLARRADLLAQDLLERVQ